MTSRTRLALVAVAAAVAFAASCNNGKLPVFPHEKHIELGAACADCHTAKGGVMPTVEACKTCHQEAMEHVTPAQTEAILKAHGKRQGAFGLNFDHAKHDGVACNDCHTIVNGRQQIPAMSTCLNACHGAQAQIPLACNTCHRDLEPSGKPSDHRAGWQRNHGPTAIVSSATCKSCHTEESCFSCHQTQKPISHNQAWRLRGHGIVAQMDRERCQSCHRQDLCTRCHLNTQPINHVNSWKGGATTHCNNCHLPLSSNTCSTCHQSASHSSAPAWPTNMTHVTGAVCRTCHIGPGQKLEHPDNGDNCETCHAK